MGTQTLTRKQICVCFTLKFQEEQLPLLCLLTIVTYCVYRAYVQYYFTLWSSQLFKRIHTHKDVLPRQLPPVSRYVDGYIFAEFFYPHLSIVYTYSFVLPWQGKNWTFEYFCPEAAYFLHGGRFSRDFCGTVQISAERSWLLPLSAINHNRFCPKWGQEQYFLDLLAVLICFHRFSWFSVLMGKW